MASTTGHRPQPVQHLDLHANPCHLHHQAINTVVDTSMNPWKSELVVKAAAQTINPKFGSSNYPFPNGNMILVDSIKLRGFDYFQ
jgi:hypothetical protein